MNLPLDKKLNKFIMALIRCNGEGGVSGGGNWGRVDVCAFVQKHSSNLDVATACSLHQRCKSSLGIKRNYEIKRSGLLIYSWQT